MRAVTLTLHPAVDRILEVASLVPGGTFDARPILAVPAGKGVNTARSLSSVWPARDTIVAATWIGEDQSAWFQAWLREHHRIETAIYTRTCFTRNAYTVLEKTGRETHMKEAMLAPAAAEERALLASWAKTIRRGDIVALCGSAPAGTSPKTLRALFALARRAGASTIVADTNGPALDAASTAGLDGIKGNAAEAGAWLGLRGALDLDSASHRVKLRAALQRRGAPKSMLITLGAEGAALATPENIVRAKPPRLPKSAQRAATGCGDAATAGWLWALRDKCSPDETLRRAIACGTAKLASVDPGELDRGLVQRLLKKVSVSVL